MSFDFVTSGYPSLDYIMQVNHAPSPGETGVILNKPPLDAPYLGGCALNIAVAGSRLGLNTAVITLLGNDSAGRYTLKKLQEEGVDTALGVKIAADGSSAVTLLFIDPENRHQTFYFPGVSDCDENELWQDNQKLPDISWGVIAVGNPNHNRQVLESYVKYGLKILWTHKNDSRAYPPSLVKRLAEVSNLVILNRFEAEAVNHILGLSDIRGLLNYTPEAIILTQGVDGSRILTKDNEIHVPIVHPDKMVDPTGAGDGFTAGVLFGLCNSFSLEQSCRTGAVVASFVLEDWGCQTNLPDYLALSERYQMAFGTPFPKEKLNG